MPRLKMCTNTQFPDLRQCEKIIVTNINQWRAKKNMEIVFEIQRSTAGQNGNK